MNKKAFDFEIFSFREILLIAFLAVVILAGSSFILAEDISVEVIPVKFVILPLQDSIINVPVIITIQAQDAFGNVVGTYNGGVKLRASGHADGTGIVTITNGVGTIGLSDSSMETVNLFLSDVQNTGFDVSSTQTINFGAGTVAKLILECPSSASVTLRSKCIASRRDQSDNVILNGVTQVYLYTSSIGQGAGFFDAENNGSAISFLTIPEGSFSGNFWIQDHTSGSHIITVSDNSTAPDGATGLIDSTGNVIFSSGNADKFVLNNPGNMTENTRVKYTVSRKDTFDNLATTGALTVYLYATPTVENSVFYDADTEGNVINSVVIPDKSASADFWYFANKTGNFAITASDNSSAPDAEVGIKDATDNILVVSAPVEVISPPPADPIPDPTPIPDPIPAPDPAPAPVVSGGGGGGGGGVINYVVNAITGENGSISPSGSVYLSSGSNQTFVITPAEGYEVLDVVVDGISVGPKASYTFSNIFTNRSISVNFKKSVIVSAGKIGDINGDKAIDELDLSIIMSFWGQTKENLSADLNKDKTVDELDLSILMANWQS